MEIFRWIDDDHNLDKSDDEEPHLQSRLCKFDPIIQKLVQKCKVSKYVCSQVPDPEEDGVEFNCLKKSVSAILVELVDRFMDKVCELLYPSDPDGLWHRYLYEKAI